MFQVNNSKANATIDHFVRFITIILRSINKVNKCWYGIIYGCIIIMLGSNSFIDRPKFR